MRPSSARNAGASETPRTRHTTADLFMVPTSPANIVSTGSYAERPAGGPPAQTYNGVGGPAAGKRRSNRLRWRFATRTVASAGRQVWLAKSRDDERGAAL